MAATEFPENTASHIGAPHPNPHMHHYKDRAASLKQYFKGGPVDHQGHIRIHWEHMPEIREWKWLRDWLSHNIKMLDLGAFMRLISQSGSAAVVQHPFRIC